MRDLGGDPFTVLGPFSPRFVHVGHPTLGPPSCCPRPGLAPLQLELVSSSILFPTAFSQGMGSSPCSHAVRAPGLGLFFTPFPSSRPRSGAQVPHVPSHCCRVWHLLRVFPCQLPLFLPASCPGLSCPSPPSLLILLRLGFLL